MLFHKQQAGEAQAVGFELLSRNLRPWTLFKVKLKQDFSFLQLLYAVCLI